MFNVRCLCVCCWFMVWLLCIVGRCLWLWFVVSFGCVLFFSLLVFVCWLVLLFVVSCFVFVDGCYLLFAGCCIALFVVCCLLFDVVCCGVLLVVSCLLVCLLLLVHPVGRHPPSFFFPRPSRV